MQVEFCADELILTLVGLIRATDPRLLQQGPDGFSLDFASLERKEQLNEDERLLIRLRGALEGMSESGTMALQLSWAEGRRLAETLYSLEKLQDWAPDVIAMCRKLRERLLGLTESAE